MYKYLTIIFSLFFTFSTEALQVKTQHLPISSELRASAIQNSVAWVAGSKNVIFKSLDSGKTWINVSLNSNKHYDFRDIEIINKDTVIVMAAGTGEDSALFITSDQGKHWQLLYNNPDDIGFFNSISFINENLGFLMGDPVKQHFTLKRTQDGGKTWSTIDMRGLPDKHKDEIAFAASGNTLLTSSQQQVLFASGGKQAAVYQISNEANLGSKITLPLHDKTATSGAYAISENHKGDLFALGGDYKDRKGHYANIVVFNKQGKIINQVVNYGGLVSAMQCSDTLCIAVGKHNTYLSENDGYTWRLLNTQSSKGFYTLAQSDGVFIAAGSNGKIATMSHKLPFIDVEIQTK